MTTNEMIDQLRREGFVVTRPEWSSWIVPIDLMRQNSHLSRGGFYKRLRKYRGEYPRERSYTGRLLRLRTTPELLAFLAKPLAKGERTDLEVAR